jgi:hypothetical protein
MVTHGGEPHEVTWNMWLPIAVLSVFAIMGSGSLAAPVTSDFLGARRGPIGGRQSLLFMGFPWSGGSGILAGLADLRPQDHGTRDR